MADWMPKSARPYRPASARPDVTGAESFARGAYQGAGMGFADEQSGALDALGGHLKRTFTNDWKHTGGGWLEDIKAEFGQVTDDYQRGRDESRQAYAEAQEANPVAYGTGQFGGAVATGLMTGGASALGRAGLKGALTAGALEGAAGGVGSSEADLTKQDVDAYARTFRDSLEGAAKGAAFGGVGYGVGKGLKWVGGKALGALKNARGELTDGISAEQQVADDAARAAEEKAARAAAKKAATEAKAASRAKSQQQKEFRAANERTQVDKRYADPSAKPPLRLVRPRPAPEGPVEDPNTQILGGYRGKAGERRAVNYDRVRQYREDIADPNFAGDKGRLEEYARQYGDAVDNPAAFERRMVERYLRENYPAEVAERILRERVGPGGEILPRASAPASAPEAMAENPALLRQRERGFGAQNMGAARYGDETIAYPNADIRRAQAPSGDPFHDAKTKVGLMETTPASDAENGLRTFEFQHPVTKKPYEVVAREHGRDPNGIYLEIIQPKGISTDDAISPEVWAQERGQLGPGIIKQVGTELARKFRGRRILHAERSTGANPREAMKMTLPEVTQAGRPVFPPEPPPAIARSGDPFHDARTKVGLMETSADGGYAGEGHNMMRDFEFKDPKSGRLVQMTTHRSPHDDGAVVVDGVGFKDQVEKGLTYQDQWGEGANKVGPRVLKEVLGDLRRAYPGSERVGGQRVTGINPGRDTSVPMPEVTEAGSRTPWLPEPTHVMDAGDAVRQGRFDDLMELGRTPTLEDLRGVEQPPSYTPQPPREAPVSMDDLRDWTGTPPEPRAAPESFPEMEDLTQPGRPAFPGDARTAAPFAPRPSLRQGYQPRSAQPVPDFDPALAERRAMAAQAQAGAGGAPTRNARPTPPRPAPAYDPEASMNAPRDFDAETFVPEGGGVPSRSATPSPVAPELAPEPIQVQPLRQAMPRPLAPPVTPPAQTTMGAPPGSLVRQARPSAEEMAGQQEAGALGGLVRAGWEGARRANNALAAPFGAAYGIGKEAMENPAVRARAISLFRLDRLARVRPEVWARVGPTLQRAMQAGPERFKAERHVLLLRDPEFRAAEAEADTELERMDGQPPTRRAAAAR